MRLNEEKKKHTENIVMIVEDDPAMRQKLRKILSASCRIIDAIDVSIMANTYQQYLPNVVIVDDATSIKGGHDVIKDILAYDPDAFIIMTSEACTQEVILRSKERGAKGFICKPFKHEIVAKYIAMAGVNKPPVKK